MTRLVATAGRSAAMLGEASPMMLCLLVCIIICGVFVRCNLKCLESTARQSLLRFAVKRSLYSRGIITQYSRRGK